MNRKAEAGKIHADWIAGASEDRVGCNGNYNNLLVPTMSCKLVIITQT